MAGSSKKKHIVWKEWLEWVFSTFKDLRFRNQLYVFFICLLISVFIWFSIKLSKEYNTSVKHLVEYNNLPQDKVLINNPPTEVYLQVKGQGMDLFKAIIREPNQPLQINLDDVELEKSGEHTFVSEVPSVWFLSQIARQSEYYEKLVDIKPDTLLFRFEGLKYKKVPVKAKLDYKLDDQIWFRKPVTVDPDSVVVSGIISAVDTVNSVPTRKTDLGVVKEQISKRVKLKEFSSRFLDLEVDSVSITVPAEKFTESQFTIPIHANTPEGIELKAFPDKVTITFRVSLEDYERVESSMFRAAVNYHPGKGQFLQVEIVRAPNFVRINEIEPKEIEYILLQ